MNNNIETIMANKRPVPPEGPLDASLVILGEAPGGEEDKHGKPFYEYARTGGLFNRLLPQADINRSQCYIDNAFDINPPGNKIDRFIKYNPRIKQVNTTQLYQEREALMYERLTRLTNKKTIIAMGNVALYATTRLWGIEKYRGSILWSDKCNCKVVACIHPAAALRAFLDTYFIIHDFKRGLDQSKFKEYILRNRRYILQPTYEQAMEYLNRVLTNKKFIAYDIECGREELSHISFAQEPEEAISIDFLRNGANTYTIEEETNLILKIAKILEDPTIRKSGHNLAFDNWFLYEKYGIVVRNFDDSGIGHKVLFPDFRAGLDFVTSIYTDMPYYKDEGKAYMNIGGRDIDFCRYSAKDASVSVEIMPIIKTDLESQKNMDTYLWQKRLIPPLTFMSTRGIRVDTKGWFNKKIELEKEVSQMQDELNTICGREINVKGASLKSYLYGEKKIRPSTKMGVVTLDEKALVRIKAKGYREAELALEIRRRRTLLEKYLNIRFKGGRLVCAYNPMVSDGRLSSSTQIIGKYGTNNQNIPHTFDQYLLADDGYLIWNFDLSQADNRTVAYIAPEPKMIKAFEDKIDVHSLTASQVFGIPIDEIIDMNKKGILATVGSGDKTHRAWGKELNHALNYDMGYITLATNIEVTASEARLFYNSYHRVYPNIKQSYHVWVRGDLEYRGKTLTNPFGRKALFVLPKGDKLFKQAYAWVPASTTADTLNRYGLIAMYEDSQTFGPMEMQRQVHDSLTFQTKISHGVLRLAKLARDIKKQMEQPITYRGRSWTIPIDITVGYNLKDQIELDFSKPIEPQLQKIIEDKKGYKPMQGMISSIIE